MIFFFIYCFANIFGYSAYTVFTIHLNFLENGAINTIVQHAYFGNLIARARIKMKVYSVYKNLKIKKFTMLYFLYNKFYIWPALYPRYPTLYPLTVVRIYYLTTLCVKIKYLCKKTSRNLQKLWRSHNPKSKIYETYNRNERK